MKFKDVKELTVAIADLAKSITGYFNPSAYESRVLRGLVGTGDGLADIAEVSEKKIKGGENLTRNELDYLRHFRRKWKSDRLKLR